MAKAKKKRRKKGYVFTKARKAALRKAQAANRKKGKRRSSPKRGHAKRHAAPKKRHTKRHASKEKRVHVHVTVKVAGAKGGRVTAAERRSGTLGAKGRKRKCPTRRR